MLENDFSKKYSNSCSVIWLFLTIKRSKNGPQDLIIKIKITRAKLQMTSQNFWSFLTPSDLDFLSIQDHDVIYRRTLTSCFCRSLVLGPCRAGLPEWPSFILLAEGKAGLMFTLIKESGASLHHDQQLGWGFENLSNSFSCYFTECLTDLDWLRWIF